MAEVLDPKRIYTAGRIDVRKYISPLGRVPTIAQIKRKKRAEKAKRKDKKKK